MNQRALGSLDCRDQQNCWLRNGELTQLSLGFVTFCGLPAKPDATNFQWLRLENCFRFVEEILAVPSRSPQPALGLTLHGSHPALGCRLTTNSTPTGDGTDQCHQRRHERTHLSLRTVRRQFSPMARAHNSFTDSIERLYLTALRAIHTVPHALLRES